MENVRFKEMKHFPEFTYLRSMRIRIYTLAAWLSNILLQSTFYCDFFNKLYALLSSLTIQEKNNIDGLEKQFSTWLLHKH